MTSQNLSSRTFAGQVRRLRTDHRQHPLSAPGSSLAATDLRLSEDYDLCPMFPHLNKFLNFLAGKARRPAALGHRGACALDQAGRNSRGQRRV